MDTIRSDIQNAKAYIIKMDDRIAGYMCIDFDGEPAYADIQGTWRAQKPYAVIHRMAFQKEFRGIGLTDLTFKLIEKLCIQNDIYYIRVAVKDINYNFFTYIPETPRCQRSGTDILNYFSFCILFPMKT
jgi:hypothetical protein